MSRLPAVLVTLSLVALSCSGSSDVQPTAAPDAIERAEPASSLAADDETSAATTTTDATASTEITDEADEAEAPASVDVDASPVRLLPDPERWVVVDDWSEPPGDLSSSGSFNVLQLDVAPLDAAGVPQLSQRIALGYRLGPVDDLDREWGDASSMGTPVNFVVDSGGVGRSVRNDEMGFAMAVVWQAGTFVSIQAQHSETDLTELAQSLTEVDEETWTAARAGAEDQRRIAVQAAMENIDPVEPAGEPMPHWVLPEPWELQMVTDMTIWTPEQQAQSVAFREAMQPPMPTAPAPGDYQSWKYGFADTADEAARQFVPQITISAVVFDEEPPNSYPTNYPALSALGLDGVIYPVGGSGTSAELGTELVRVNVRTTNFSEAEMREFLDVLEFATDNPLDGFIVNDPRFQLIELAEWEQRPPNWHAWWEKPDGGPEAVISVWRLSVPELRMWMLSRGDGLAIPTDVWETIASNGVIDFGSAYGQQTSYDVETGLLRSLRGVKPIDLLPIELDDWIALAAPVNTDPLKPR